MTDLRPPALPDLHWRPISRDQLDLIGELALACHAVDGGLGFLNEPEHLLELYFPNPTGLAIGAINAEGRLAACASVHLSDESETKRLKIAGQVHPDQRSRGIGTFLMEWSLAKARTLLAGATGSQPVLQIRTESLTDQADRLYRAYGFTCVFEELVMQRDLQSRLPDRPLPSDLTLANWHPTLGEQFYQAYHPAFRERPGFPAWSAAEWISHVIGNDLMPEWTLLASAGDLPAGFIIGTIDLSTEPPGGYVWQIGVIPGQRRRGIASGLLVETMRRMQAAEIPWCLLAVNLNNPGAIQAYTRLGFTTIGQRARYERII